MEKNGETILKGYGAEEIKDYCLFGVYGYTFKLGLNKYDIKYCTSYHGFAIESWKIIFAGTWDKEDLNRVKDTLKRIETEFNEELSPPTNGTRTPDELKEARGRLEAIEDIAREILNRPNTENTRVILKRALTDILDIAKSGEEVNEDEN